MVEHLMSHDLFSDSQHGFVPGRSCVTQLLHTLEEWTTWLDQGEKVDVVYLDFQKAFDSVPHQRLLSKLDAYKIQGNFKTWIADFLHGRTQRVVVNNARSQWCNVKSGVPQGSVLGPTLFVLYINDLPEVLDSTVRIYADDTKAFSCVSTPDQRKLLQADLCSLTDWSSKWQLQFNARKCCVLHLGSGDCQERYTIGSSALSTVEETKDLGVLVDDKLKFHSHVSYAINKANRVLISIRRAFQCHDTSTIPKLFKGLVRPLLEYGNVIWSPRYISDAKAVERVQKRATKMISTMKHLPYIERLKCLNLPSLEYRRRRGDMIQVYKIIYEHDRLNPDHFFQLADTPTRGHSLKLSKPRCRTNVRKNTFSHRVIDDWNSLPEVVVQAPTIDAFKTRLDRCWKEQCHISHYSN